MDIQGLLNEIFTAVIIPLLAVLTSFAIKWINAKAEELKATTDNQYIDKYVDLLNNTITATVIAVNQTYVDTLKEKDAFTEEAQKEAFKRVFETVKLTLTKEATLYLEAIIGDLNAYITTKIEEAVKINKMSK